MPDAEPDLTEAQRRAAAENYERRGSGTPSVPLLALPLCMSFTNNIGGNSLIGRRLSMNVFSQAMSGVGLNRVNVPMTAIDRRHLGFSRMSYGMEGML